MRRTTNGRGATPRRAPTPPRPARWRIQITASGTLDDVIARLAAQLLGGK